MTNDLLDLYSDYLISSCGAVTATGLSALVERQVSHDHITRFLARPQGTAADLGRIAKPYVRHVQSSDGVLLIDDSSAEKPSTDENDIICWHSDPAHDRLVKGINVMTALYHRQEVALPVGFTLIAKTAQDTDKQTGNRKRRSPTGKNEYCRAMIRPAVTTHIAFRYVLTDVWFAAAETLGFIKEPVHKDFILPLKRNRKVALSQADQQQGRYQRVAVVMTEPDTVREVYLEEVPFPLLLVKHVFTNEDGTTGVWYLVTSDTTQTADGMTTLYRPRSSVEVYHKSRKQNASLEPSPTRTVVTQTQHVVAALCGYIKLDMLNVATKRNHCALQTSLDLRAVQSAFTALRELQPIRLAA
jgi:hypothetical protein